jgi:hypothetical protein
MSDYLTNLVSRSTEQGNLLAPRLPSAFESQTSDVQAQSFESSTESEHAPGQLQSPEIRDERHASESKSFERQDDAQAAFPPHHEIKLFGDVSIVDDLNDVDLESSQQYEEADQREPSAESSALHEAPNTSGTINDSFEMALEIPSYVHAQSRNLQRLKRDGAKKVRTRGPHTPQHVKTSRQARAADKPTNIALPVELSREAFTNDVRDFELDDAFRNEQTAQSTGTKRPRRTGEASVARERELRASLPMDQLLERSSSEGSAYSDGASSTHNAEPVINVTIGRIEVKATQSSPTERRGTQRSPVMPLDEYLKLQRRGSSK